MNAISYTQKISSIIENFNPNQLGIYFSLFLHLIILLFAIGLPDLFKPQPVILANIIPIEIVNIAETTSISEKIFKNNLKLENNEGEKLRSLLYLYERDAAIKTLLAG